VEFLREHNVDTSSLESRAETLINNGVMFGDNTKVADSQVAGAGSRLSRMMPHARGAEGAASAEGGS
jgi:hypothetical protein